MSDAIMQGSAQTPAAWERCAWAAGVVFVLALLAELAVAVGIGLTHQDSAATIATGLHAHEQRTIVIACISIVYAVAFVVYLWKLYYLTYALDSVADVFGSLAFLAAGLLILHTGDLPRRLGWVAIATAPFLLLQGFGLGGVIATFGLALDLVGFLLLLVFVVATSVVGLRAGAGRAQALTSSR